MAIVVIDFTNKTWAVEQPNDGYLHVGYTGEPGPRLLDILDFVGIRHKQFEKFVAKRRVEEADAEKRRNTGKNSSPKQLQSTS